MSLWQTPKFGIAPGTNLRCSQPYYLFLNFFFLLFADRQHVKRSHPLKHCIFSSPKQVFHPQFFSLGNESLSYHIVQWATCSCVFWMFMSKSYLCWSRGEKKKKGTEHSKGLTTGTQLIWRLERKFVLGISVHLIEPAAFWKHSCCPFMRWRNFQVSLVLWFSTLSQIQVINAYCSNWGNIWNRNSPLNAYYHSSVRDHCPHCTDFQVFVGMDKEIQANDLRWQLLS